MVSQIKGPYREIFPKAINYIKRELESCETVLDLGCGRNSSLQHCSVPYSLGVEIFKHYLEESRRKGIHTEYVKADVRKIEFKPCSFDAILALDVLEHLTKEEGLILIKKMENWARKKIIIFTPNEYLWQNGYDNNPYQEHKSGWGVRDLEKFGFEVFGIIGWKKLRGSQASMKYKPTFLWGIFSDLTQIVTHHHPELAFQLLAIKQVRGDK